MAKATPEELAMHQSAQQDETTFDKLANSLEGNNSATDNTANGDHDTDTITTPPKRKRGRPSNAEKALSDVLEKENPGAAVGAAVEASKPGRKPKAGVKPTGEALGKQLVGLHALVAMVLQLPVMQISPEEGASLGSAIVAVCDEYGLSVTGKTGAALQLLGAMGMIYIPRVFMIKAMQAQATAAPQAAADGSNVHQFHPGNGGN